jgi:hypothetical protein
MLALDAQNEELMPPFPSEPADSEVMAMFDREYRRHGDEALLATIYQPAGTGPFPMMLAVHVAEQ